VNESDTIRHTGAVTDVTIKATTLGKLSTKSLKIRAAVAVSPHPQIWQTLVGIQNSDLDREFSAQRIPAIVAGRQDRDTRLPGPITAGRW
jgi:hypothetical protein